VAQVHLAALSGRAFAPGTPSETQAPVAHSPLPSAKPARKERMPPVDDEQRRRIEEALRANGGNVAAAARALGLHRTQLRRLLERHGILLDGAPQGTDPQSASDSTDE
jgi:transcriptional regulator with GAF, ATPase, and Fis domain